MGRTFFTTVEVRSRLKTKAAGELKRDVKVKA
jgi:hypothetical protein